MARRTRWLPRRPKITAVPWAGIVAVHLSDPQIMVAEEEHIAHDKRSTRSVGLTFEQDGVRVDVEIVDVRQLITDLAEAEKWALG